MMRACLYTVLLAAGLYASVLDGYDSPQQLEQAFHKSAAKHPKIAQTRVLTSTPGGRPVQMVILGQEQSPAIAIVAGLEGNDLAGPEICRRFVETACRLYGHADSVTALLDKTCFYIFPCMNPDARARAFRKPFSVSSVNDRTVDDDRDGEADEDGPEDLDGDGAVVMMRVTSPFGEWMPDPDFPNLLRRADPAKQERGLYKLYSEGVDNDGDGLWNEDGPGGVDIGRNFSFRYRIFASGSGTGPFSEVESRALADFFFDHPDIFAVFSFGSRDNLLHPWEGAKETSEEKPPQAPPPQDAAFYRFIAERYKRILRLPVYEAAPADAGTFAEWAYFHFGRWSFCAPAWLPPADSAESKLSLEKALYRWSGGERFVPWHRIEHPDFRGRAVEVGGRLPYADSPPADSLDALAGRYSDFFLDLARRMPTLELSVEAERLGRDLYRVTATLGNSGRLPTASKLGDRVQWLRKIKIELLLDEKQQLVSGKRFYLENGLLPGTAVEKSWTITAQAGRSVRVEASSPSVGRTVAAVQLR